MEKSDVDPAIKPNDGRSCSEEVQYKELQLASVRVLVGSRWYLVKSFGWFPQISSSLSLLTIDGCCW